MGLREFKLFRTLIHERTGIWLRDGKQVMLASRLSRRLRHHGLANFADYYQYVQKVQDNSDEIRELINCVTTNKTSFFRERHHFEFLANTVVPEIAVRGSSRRPEEHPRLERRLLHRRGSLTRSPLPCLRRCSAQRSATTSQLPRSRAIVARMRARTSGIHHVARLLED